MAVTGRARGPAHGHLVAAPLEMEDAMAKQRKPRKRRPVLTLPRIVIQPLRR